MNLDVKPTWKVVPKYSYARYYPINHTAISLASLMRADHFTKSNLHTWLHMGGSVTMDGKPWVG